ncbi:MAG: SLC13 family permease [Acidiferrobacteraceae bacterium]
MPEFGSGTAVEMGEDQTGVAIARKRATGFVLACALLLGFHFGPAIGNLKPEAQTVLGVFLWFIVCMVTEALPKAIVGLASPLLLVIFAHTKVPAAFGAFNTDIFFLATGAFMIASILMGTPLGRRITLTVASAMKSTRVTRLLVGLSLAELVTQPFLPVVNESALFLPICKGVSSFMEGREHQAEARRINIALLYMIAGLVPLFIGPLMLTSAFPNLILVSYLKTTQGISISWARWFWLNLPLWGLLPIVYFYVVWYFDLRGLDIPNADAGISGMKQTLGKITWPEVWALLCLALGMILWITGWLSPGMTALLVASLMFVPWSGIKFEQVGRHILWDVLMLLGGAISLGGALYHSGAVTWISGAIVSAIRAPGLPLTAVLFLLVFGLHIARAGIVSAVAAGAAFVPLAAGLAKALHVHVLPFALVVVNCMQYAFFLPISITAFLIAWSASGTSGWHAVKFGTPLTILANVYVILVQPLWLKLLGLPL